MPELLQNPFIQEQSLPHVLSQIILISCVLAAVGMHSRVSMTRSFTSITSLTRNPQTHSWSNTVLEHRLIPDEMHYLSFASILSNSYERSYPRTTASPEAEFAAAFTHGMWTANNSKTHDEYYFEHPKMRRSGPLGRSGCIVCGRPWVRNAKPTGQPRCLAALSHFHQHLNFLLSTSVAFQPRHPGRSLAIIRY